MSDWQIGDLAVRLADDRPPSDPARGPAVHPGHVYVVEAVTPFRTWKSGAVGVGLILLGVRHFINIDGDFFEGLFSKIRPDEHEACEPEFVTLLKRAKRPVSA